VVKEEGEESKEEEIWDEINQAAALTSIPKLP